MAMERLAHEHGKRLRRQAGWRFGVGLGLGLCIAGAGAAFGQSEGEWVAHVRAVGFGPVPAGTPMAVSAQDFNDINTRLQPVIEQALVAQGFPVEPNARLRLVFATELALATMGARSEEPSNSTEVGDAADDETMFSAAGDTAPHSAEFKDVVPQVTVPLDGKEGPATSSYSLSFLVVGADQAPVWQGSVRALLPPQDSFAIVSAMVPLLIPQIGKSVEARHAFPN